MSGLASSLYQPLFSRAGGAEPAGSWYVVRAKPRQAKVLAERLARRGVRHFLPVAAEIRQYAGHSARVVVPLFGDLLFVHAEASGLAQLKGNTALLLSILPIPDQAQFQNQLQELELALSAETRAFATPQEAAGAPVQVRTGPLRGLRGVTVSDDAPDAIALPIDAIHAAAIVPLNGAELAPLAEATLPVNPQWPAAQTPLGARSTRQ